MAALLEVERLEAFYGPTQVLHGIDLAVAERGITTLLGTNGAGKTTTLKAICAMVKTAGTIRFDGRPIERLATEDIVRLGIGHVPEGRGTFIDLTVQENLRLGGYTRRGEAADDMERMYGFFPVLAERRNQQAGTLSGGEQQMLAIARGLMSRPRLLVLDEPSFGLAPKIIATIFEILKRINDEDGVSILLVEQNAALALEFADDVFLLETGHVAMSGSAAELRADESVRRAYLGY